PARQVQPQEVLLEHLASAALARHAHEAGRAVEAHRDMAERRERREVAAGPAAEVQDDEGRFALDVAQQLGDVLADVVVARAQPEVLRPALVVRKRERAGLPGWPA